MDEAKPFKQRPNIGSRVTREGHARFWERPEVKFLRATRRFETLPGCRHCSRFTLPPRDPRIPNLGQLPPTDLRLAMLANRVRWR